ncbi:MAG: penicillin-binding transpeptidase domain-containing protein [Candidatus Omnitrophota bacterium]
MPERGCILDRKGSALAANIVSYAVFTTKKAQVDAQQRAKLAAILGLDKNILAAKLDSGKNFVWLKRRVDPKVAEKVSGLKIFGLGKIREFKRFYPDSNLACHIVGFTNIDNEGLEGIEKQCDRYLSGIKGWCSAEKDAKRREVVCWKQKSILPSDGYDVVLTIDSVIQSITERNLRKIAQKYKVVSATAIVMDPANGDILALYNYPDYDLKNVQAYKSERRRNLAVTDSLEPGSSFKFITAGAALEEKKITLKNKIFCERGSYLTGGRVLHDYKPYGTLTFKEVIGHSSNIGTSKVAALLGNDLLYKYIRDFGFGELTGIELPGEVRGLLRPTREWSHTSLASIAIGQEIGVTPLQLICAISCVANNGLLLKPRIIKSIQTKDGRFIKSFPVVEKRRVISEETACLLKEVLTECVENGTGKEAQVEGYTTAGKTGTAQKPNPQGGYYKHKYFASFVGFVPVEQPRVAILVILNDPHPLYFGGVVSAPVFRNIATETLRYLDTGAGPAPVH